MTAGVFSIRRVTFCLLPLLVLAMWVLALSGFATASNTATASSPARLRVQIPAMKRNADAMVLDIGITVVRRPPASRLAAVVRFKRPDGATAKIGQASLARDDDSYRFDVGGLRGGGTGEVEISLVDPAGGPPPADAELAIAYARIVAP